MLTLYIAATTRAGWLNEGLLTLYIAATTRAGLNECLPFI